jgi:hypothetical protein
MTHISKRAYKPLTNDINREDTGIYWDEPNGRMVAGHDGTIYEAPLHIASQARGDILRRGANTWERLAAGGNGVQLIGDGTDIVVAGSYHHAMALERQKNRCFVNFLKQPAVAIHAKDTMAIVTAANAQQDFFHVNGHYFELAQGVGAAGANTALAAAGLTPGVSGWLLPGDNTATDSVEITRGIVAGSACSFVTGVDSFFIRCAFLITTRANHTHLMMGFRPLAAYGDVSTNAAHLAAYSGAGDDAISIGLNNNAGRLGRHITKAGADAEANATHGAIANGTVMALQIGVTAGLATSYLIGHATPAGTSYAEYEAARVAAIADLAVDATWTAGTVTTGLTLIPSIAYGMAGGAAASDTTIMSFECSYNE